MKNCKKCAAEFEVTQEDRDFLKKLSPKIGGVVFDIPEPTLCPDCRRLKRLTWRNERTIYKRKCDGSGKDIISTFAPDKPYKVYSTEYWFSDKWDGLDYGRDFDFSRPFFEQFEELMKEAPLLCGSLAGNHNSDYTNESGWNKNCYLVFEADYNENCFYSNNIYTSRALFDVYGCSQSELCYDCLNCQKSYNLMFSINCNNCSDSYFLKNCIGCKNCFGCVNLKNKENYFLNEKCSKEEFEKKVSQVDLQTYDGIVAMKKSFLDFVKKYPHKYCNGVQNEDSSGDYLWNTQRCENCFNLENAQDCKNCSDARNVKNLLDVTAFGSENGAEFCYECQAVGAGSKNLCFCDQVWIGAYNVFYSKFCVNNCHDLFGCVGLKHQSYCILNKKYSKEEYEVLLAKIIEHMRKTGEWGEFFSSSISNYAYNESMAQAYHPLTKEEAVSAGYAWRDPDPKEYLKQTCVVPAKIADVPDSIVDEILACRECGKNYKIVEEELKFYRRQGLPVPLKCPDCRNLERFKLKNPRVLWDRNCDKCGVQLRSTFEPQRPEKVYCEKCYLGEVY
ncbi:hypothetical protein KJ632_02445 [Patescibacteria group bacterium]|nr:hypothetical protein [Patescibacteria group bacterium]